MVANETSQFTLSFQTTLTHSGHAACLGEVTHHDLTQLVRQVLVVRHRLEAGEDVGAFAFELDAHLARLALLPHAQVAVPAAVVVRGRGVDRAVLLLRDGLLLIPVATQRGEEGKGEALTEIQTIWNSSPGYLYLSSACTTRNCMKRNSSGLVL